MALDDALQPLEQQMQQATRWLVANVSAEAASQLLDEIAASMARVEEHPHIGPPTTNAGTRTARRLQLPTEPYHLYYRIDAKHAELVLVAVWHMSRGGRPRL